MILCAFFENLLDLIILYPLFKMSRYKVNQKLLPMKAHYFFFNAGLAPLMPFIPTYARQLGVSQVGVGLMYTVFPFVGLLVKPLFGSIADKFKIGKTIFMSAVIFTAIFFSSIYFIPSQSKEAYMSLDCNKMTLLKTCDIHDNCTLAKINLENQDYSSLLECTLVCSNPPEQFSDEMCNTWNLTAACSFNASSVFTMTTYSNISKALHEQSCLYLPVESILYDSVQYQFPYCHNLTPIKCKVECNSATIMSYIEGPVSENQEEPYYSTIQFQMLFLLMIGAYASTAVTVSLGDSICFSLLGNRPHDYGAQRLWGAIGWGTFGIIAGYLIDASSVGKTYKDYTSSFVLVFIMLAIDAVSVYRIKIDYRQEPYALGEVLGLFKNVKVVLFLLCCITFGICLASIWQFLFWFLEIIASAQGCESLQWIKLLQGLAMGIQCFAGEAPFLFLSGWFLKKLGHVHTMTLILVVMGIRLIAYSFLTNPWLTLPIELLNGITLGLYWPTMASYAYLISPSGTASTLQGIFGAAFEGIGTSIGSLVGGLLFYNYGGVTMFRSFGGIAIAVGIIYSLSHLCMNYKSGDSSKASVAGIEDYSSEESYTRVHQAPPKEDQL